MRNSIYVIVFGLITLTSCQNDPTPEEVALQSQIETYDALMTEAMEVHDEIMPKMGELMELKGMLSEKYPVFNDSIVSNDTIKKAEKTSMNLKMAHDDMMSWMKDYSDKFPYGDPSPETKMAIDKKMPVLKQEVDEIVALRDRTIEAIENAKKLLEE